MSLLNLPDLRSDSEFQSLFQSSSKRRDKSKIKEILSENGLSLEETIIELKSVMENTTDQSLRAKILDIVLGMHGVKKDTEIPAAPSIVFQIQNSDARIAFLLPSPSASSNGESE